MQLLSGQGLVLVGRDREMRLIEVLLMKLRLEILVVLMLTC